jgi:hypothetical protein
MKMCFDSDINIQKANMYRRSVCLLYNNSKDLCALQQNDKPKEAKSFVPGLLSNQSLTSESCCLNANLVLAEIFRATGLVQLLSSSNTT